MREERIGNFRRRLAEEFERHRDEILLVAPFMVAAVLGSVFDVFERFADFAEQHEKLELDELFTAMLGAGLAYFVLLIRQRRLLRQALHSRNAAEARADDLIQYDTLTGLASRTALLEAIRRAQDEANDGLLSVLLVDLDRFKPINDSYGHQGGDHVLQAVAQRLLAALPDGATAGRISGDEFACILPHPAGPEAAEAMAARIRTAVAKPIQLRGGMAEISASIGIRTAPGDSCSAEQLLHSAGFARYRAKRFPDRGWCHFEAELDHEMRDRAQLEIDMRAGIHRGEFVPYFQPIVDLQTGAIAGFECLARWQHPRRGLIGPNDFIPIAEEAGMIQELAFALLDRACRVARRWPPHMTLSFNISPLQLNDRWLPQRVLRHLCSTGIAPARLIIEVTESRLFGDLPTAKTILESLKNAGVQIALDDFGTGYASLKHLRELRFDRVKIDRSFIGNLDEAENGEIVRAIFRLCRGLGLPTTAEGIEKAETAAPLAALGCDYGQGYLYSRPVDAEGALQLAHSSGFAPAAFAVAGEIRPPLREAGSAVA